MANSFVDAVLNAALSAIVALQDLASLHSGFPSTTGANEISGGSYARQSITWSSPASAAVAASNQPVFSVPAGVTIRWIGYWDTVGPAFSGFAPYRQSGDPGPTKYVVDVTGDKILAPAHGYSSTNTIVFFGGVAPGGLTEGTIYFVVNATTDDLQVAATSGGSAINLTSQGDVDVRMSRIREEAYGGAGTFTLASAATDFAT